MTSPAPNRSWLPSLLLALVIFGSGAAVGSGSTFFYLGQRMRSAEEHPELLPDRILERMRRRLELSDEQADQIGPLLEELHAGLMDIREQALGDARPRLEAHRQAIAEVLEPDQRERWESRYSELCERWLPGGMRGRRDKERDKDRGGRHRTKRD